MQIGTFRLFLRTQESIRPRSFFGHLNDSFNSRKVVASRSRAIANAMQPLYTFQFFSRVHAIHPYCYLENQAKKIQPWTSPYRTITTDDLVKHVLEVKNHRKKQNYFEIFEIPASFHLDLKDLDTRYRKLQLIWHPDRFHGQQKEKEKKELAETVSSFVNLAYDTLLRTNTRAMHLLELKNIPIKEEDGSLIETMGELLLKLLEWRETLEEISPDDKDSFEDLRVEVSDELNQAEDKAQKIFEKVLPEETMDQNLSLQAQQITAELQYLTTLLREIESKAP